MPEGVGYGPQFTASTGLALNVIGDHASATSGIVQAGAVQNTPDNLLAFTTGNYYLVGSIQFYYATDTNASDDFRYRVALNGSVIMSYLVTGAASTSWGAKNKVVIPPFTEVVVDATNIAASAAKGQCAILTGRIYGKID